MKDRRAYPAFTLVELVVAIAIFAIIAVSIYSTFMSGLRFWAKTDPVIETSRAARIFLDMAAKDMKNAIVYNPTAGQGEFAGKKAEISFMTIIDVSPSDSAPRAELAKVVYRFDGETKTVKRLVAARTEGFDENAALASIVLENVDEDDFGFEYCWQSESSEKQYDWKEEWNVSGKIPRGVRVKAGEFRRTVFIPIGEIGGGG